MKSFQCVWVKNAVLQADKGTGVPGYLRRLDKELHGIQMIMGEKLLGEGHGGRVV